MSGFSPKLPLMTDLEDGFSLTKTVTEVVSQNIKHLVLTAPGERMMDPNFGVGLRHWLFKMNTSEVRNELYRRIERQIQTYMPFLTIEDLSILGSEDEDNLNMLKVRIQYSFGRVSIKEVVELTVS